MAAGETEEKPSAWTVDTLLAHVMRLITEMDKRYEQRFEAQEKAILKQEQATERRFESVNEFRGQLADQASRFMPRAESLQRHEQTAEKIAALENRHASDVGVINSRLDLNTGRGIGIEKGWSLLIGLAGLVGGVIAIVFTLAR